MILFRRYRACRSMLWYCFRESWKGKWGIWMDTLAVLWISPNSWVAHRTTHGGKLGRPNHFLVERIILNYLWNNFFLVINTRFACYPFNQVPTYRELDRPSGDFGGHVGSPDYVMGRIWRLGDRLSTVPHLLLIIMGGCTVTIHNTRGWPKPMNLERCETRIVSCMF